MKSINKNDKIISDTEQEAIICDVRINGIEVYIDNKKEFISNEQLIHWRFANPIIDNRIVSDYTFAVRFKQFLKQIPKDWIWSQPHYVEEFEYMMIVANQLLKYQVQTAEDSELSYLNRVI